MTKNVPPLQPADLQTGWISGSMGRTLPTYNPAMLILEVVEMLGRHGVQTETNPATAMAAAADLLHALGVMPRSATAPEIGAY